MSAATTSLTGWGAHVVTLPASVQRPNEDAAVRRGGVSVLVDGAGVPAAVRPGCPHPVAWFARALADAVVDALTSTDDNDAPVSLASACVVALARVAALHPGCDAAAGPSSTLVVTRLTGTRLEYLVLCDSSLVLVRADGAVERITDTTLDTLLTRARQHAAEGEWVNVEHLRNTDDGFWVARVEPEAVDHALTGTLELGEGDVVILASDGAMRPVEVTCTMTEAVWARAALRDPHALLEAVREDERQHATQLARTAAKPHDDATVVLAAP